MAGTIRPMNAEADWLTYTDPQRMWDFLRGRADDRRLRLFAAACCRRVWPLLAREPARAAVEVAERLADGRADDAERRAARRAAQQAAEARGVTRTPTAPKWERLAASAAYWALARSAVEAAQNAQPLVLGAIGARAGLDPAGWAAAAAERRAQVALLRDIFDDPSPCPPVDPAWLTPAVVSLAQTIYDGRAFNRMPELAEGLSLAGCTDGGILGHCRGPGPHVRGCWVVDLLLGKP